MESFGRFTTMAYNQRSILYFHISSSSIWRCKVLWKMECCYATYKVSMCPNTTINYCLFITEANCDGLMANTMMVTFYMD